MFLSFTLFSFPLFSFCSFYTSFLLLFLLFSLCSCILFLFCYLLFSVLYATPVLTVDFFLYFDPLFFHIFLLLFIFFLIFVFFNYFLSSLICLYSFTISVNTCIFPAIFQLRNRIKMISSRLPLFLENYRTRFTVWNLSSTISSLRSFLPQLSLRANNSNLT